jgi:polar amino acid transport system substrate-binding protein
MKRAISALLIVMILAALPALSGCGGKKIVTVRSGQLLMFGNVNTGFLEVDYGEAGGFSGELATEIAKRLGLTLNVTIRTFSKLFSQLDLGECDIAMSAITITPERQAEVDFSDPYFASGQALLVPTSSTIAGESDLVGKKVGVLKGSTNQQEAEKIGGIGQIVLFDEKPPMFAAIAAGQLDAVICDTPFAQYNAKNTGRTRIARVLTRGDRYGIAVKKGNSALMAGINEALKEIKKDGTYDRLYKKYFGKKI